MPYEWLATAFAVIAGRGIEPHEVMQVLASSRRWVRPAHSPDGLVLRSIWGRTTTGRALIVVVRPVGGFTAKIVGAREMSAEEKEAFQTWETNR